MRHALFAVAPAALLASSALAQQHSLSGWAAIPSTYRHAGPVSGQFITGANGVTVPFAGQPIPGFSGYIPSGLGNGSWIGLPDNGYGAQNNSADFVLGIYNVTPAFRTTGNGTSTPGPVAINSFTAFNDANGILSNGAGVEQNIVAQRTTYYPSTAITVDPQISSGRLLTGADFDVESIARMNDGSYWVGEEFGPFLLHFGENGTLLSEPVAHPVLRAPQNPFGDPANLPSSRGFESMTRNADGTRLYLTTESSISTQTDTRLLEIYEFDATTGAYTDNSFIYRKDGDAVNNQIVTGDMTHVADDRYIVIERDNFEGAAAQIKKLYLVDLSETDSEGVLIKRELVDLLAIPDPLDIGGLTGDLFTLPIQSVEAVTVMDAFTLAVAVDTNYPFANGRTPGSPDDTEIITIRFDQELSSILVPAPGAAGLLGMGALGLMTRRRR